MDLATHLHLALAAPNGDKRVLLRLLELRQQLSKASTAKFQAILDRLQDDGHIRDLLMYHGAGTGRWTAKGPQLQNLPSRGLELDAEEVPAAIAAALVGMLGDLYGHPLAAASSCIRGCLTASPGHRFLCADFSAIEGRVLPWMAGEQVTLDAYAKGQRLYCVDAAGVFGRSYDEINNGRKHDPLFKMMDATGKVINLACGYQGSVGAARKMERSQGLHLGFSDAVWKGHIDAWRASRPETVRLWKALETACLDAVASPGTLTSYRDVRFKVVGKMLMMRLPSNRLLYYFDPAVEEKLMPWKKDGEPVYKDCVSFWGVDSKTKKWSKQWLYGGLLTENAVQATSRDLMAEAMLRHDAAGYAPCLTVHDEELADVPNGFGSLEEFVKIMEIVPPWAAGLPIKAEGWEGERYQK